ncbi:MBL fold metallo-hydrolase [Acidomonas methanolica]|uniref:Metallo-beta-lactamase n=1 Tax=Acidomonas methanolica NBRC 104435 TaxID=1231351 RepID=A0A023D9A7_ACIMT|nr:MBL fold metallo-hydrolase [Acidomonas methanolica]MBU2654987.1 MBL fold metallo-hydrolase [Acidomonas methanolica]TCS26338.1 glyoxylase-like metal-dependent hydrolase (beta-lactamase superfamily II) [Acidomonas methanolica]GAJ30396.1 metallo-beta-lactamase [Acidomonas methanolica NBRC 104435]GEK99131.1 hypothetical protein AME01nite_16300 [Acidomonas methanolica NBRC 104435]
MRARTVQVTPLRQNCVLLDDPATGKAVVVDPGGDVEDILAALGDAQVEAILLTHGHLDHAGGADELRDRLSERQGARVPLLGPDRRDQFLLEAIETQAAGFGLVGLKNAHPDRFLDDGEGLELLGRRIRVAHLPGHAPGHVVFLSPEDRLAIVGDTLFAGTVGRTDFPYGDPQALLDGIRTVLLTLPDDTTVLPGHGMPTTIGRERQSNPFLV